MTHGNTNCHKISQRGIWDSSRTVAHSLPPHPAAHLSSRPDEGTDNAAEMNRQLRLSPMNHTELPSPFPNNPAPLPIKFQRFFGTASPPSNCLPEFLPFFLPDAARPSSAHKALVTSHVLWWDLILQGGHWWQIKPSLRLDKEHNFVYESTFRKPSAHTLSNTSAPKAVFLN